MNVKLKKLTKSTNKNYIDWYQLKWHKQKIYSKQIYLKEVLIFDTLLTCVIPDNSTKVIIKLI